MCKLHTIRVLYDRNPWTFNQIPWVVRVVHKGDRYGRGWKLVHDGEDPLVEFYDGRCPFMDSDLGQFVTRYNLNTLLERDFDRQLVLDLGVDDWAVSSKSMLALKNWLLRWHCA